MTEFALLIDGVFQRIDNKSDRPDNIAHKAVTWHPVIREFGEPFTGLVGDSYVIRVVDPATLPPPVPAQISDRQFFHALAINEIITQEEALAAVKVGALPASLASMIDQLPSDQKFSAEMLLSGATIFERDHPLMATLGTMMSWSDEQIDNLFRQAGAL